VGQVHDGFLYLTHSDVLFEFVVKFAFLVLKCVCLVVNFPLPLIPMAVPVSLFVGQYFMATDF
jgi:hypothetical protein